MRIILHESSHSREARQSTGCLVAVNDTELRHPDWQLLIASVATVEDKTVSRTVHRFQRPFLLLHIEREHVIIIILPVTRSLPEFTVEHVR